MKLRKRIGNSIRRVRSAGGVARQSAIRLVPENISDKQTEGVVTIGNFSEEMLHLNNVAARGYAVEPAVHPSDFMYWFHAGNPSHSSLQIPINYYFDDGASSAHKLAGIIESQGLCGEERIKLLEFASGYGMVSRHLKRYPHIDCVCSDIHNEAIEFLTGALGCRAFISHSNPDEFRPGRKFEVVFALSFFTHMPKVTFGRWLRALSSTLDPGGRLIFTTHGYATLADHPEFAMPPDGFLFVPGSEQKDLDVEEYGATIVKPEYVMAEIIEHTKAQQIIYKHADWWTRQDLWIATCM